ncbi:hypothetical protein BD413DRAFT_271275 [Trametes elegans]|nr:hypothetical protein BD413DRAFT_271275 [Trametes elegans]
MCVCQSFYIRRVHMIGPQYKYLVAVAIVLLFTEFGFMVALTVRAFTGHDVQSLGKLTWIVSAIYGLAVTIDLLVTGVLITVLLNSKTGFNRTDSLIQTLIIYSINSGLITSIAGVISFVFALVLPGNMIYFAVGLIATKLYANSVLAVLNTRRFLSEQAMDGFTIDSAQPGGNLIPATSSVVFGQRDSRAVTISFPPIAEDAAPAEASTGASESLEAAHDNKA